MDENTKINLLKEEYFKLQDIYEDSDKKARETKYWSLTINCAIIGFGFQQKNEFIWLISFIAAFSFWFLEIKWKHFQYCNTKRIEEIERTFNNNDFENIKPLQIDNFWDQYYKEHKDDFWRIGNQSFVNVPHSLIMLVSAILFFLFHYHVFFFPIS